jgi:hypothetical protein
MNGVVSAILAIGGVVLLYTAPLHAAPLGGATGPSTAQSAFIKVHGYHRSCRWGSGRGWWHRHLGDGRALAAGAAYTVTHRMSATDQG